MWPEGIFGSENSKEKCEQKGLASERWNGGDGGSILWCSLVCVFFPLDSVSLRNKTTDKTGHCERDEARETAFAKKKYPNHRTKRVF